MDDSDFTRGYELFSNFVRGDALIGLIADVPAVEREMLDALWASATRGNARAYRIIGDCFMARLRSNGAFEGISADEANGRPWSAKAAQIVDDDNDSLQAALRGYYEAALLGDREAALHFARMTRPSTRQNQELALQVLSEMENPNGAEIYQKGLVQNWLGALEDSVRTHLIAAELGNADAQFELYIVYAQGLGVTADAEKSRAWLLRAADAEHPRALYNLGVEHATGARGEIDMKKAAEFYERAAKRGNGRAAATLGVMMITDELEGTKERAIEWLNEADELGYASWQMLEQMGIDDPREGENDDEAMLTPFAFVEVEVDGAWQSYDVEERRVVEDATPLDRIPLPPAVHALLKGVCTDACPTGAGFSAAHEAAFSDFDAEMRETHEPEENEIYGAGALTEQELRSIAESLGEHDHEEPETIEGARAEVLRWADAIAGIPNARIAYWFAYA